MAAEDRCLIAEELEEARWNAWMDALEANWLAKIAATQTEYQEELMRLKGERPGSAGGTSFITYQR